MRGLVVRTCLLIDFLAAIPIFAALIIVNPHRYADTLAQSGETIRRKILEYSGERVDHAR